MEIETTGRICASPFWVSFFLVGYGPVIVLGLVNISDILILI